ncbi:MAG: hypothetical protein GY851_10540 [bacterium]|nr:hypothetical protein [bacterium]
MSEFIVNLTEEQACLISAKLGRILGSRATNVQEWIQEIIDRDVDAQRGANHLMRTYKRAVAHGIPSKRAGELAVRVSIARDDEQFPDTPACHKPLMLAGA